MAHHLLAAVALVGACFWAQTASAFSATPSRSHSRASTTCNLKPSSDGVDEVASSDSRRSVLSCVLLVGCMGLNPMPSNAGIDPSALRALPVEGVCVMIFSVRLLYYIHYSVANDYFVVFVDWFGACRGYYRSCIPPQSVRSGKWTST